MNPADPFQSIVDASERVSWRVEDVLPAGAALDFSRPFLPEAMARVKGLSFLEPGEQLALNQIRANGYLSIFGVFEEAFLPFMLDQMGSRRMAADRTTRALLRFADEEVKHIELFRGFRERFEAGFGTPCRVVGPASAMTAQLVDQSPLAIALITLHVEWMTQRHYVESVKDDDSLEPLFVRLLKYHWLEEAQHARIDSIIVRALASRLTAKEVEAGIEEYLRTCQGLSSTLALQAALDVESLSRALGKTFAPAVSAEIQRVQTEAWRWTILDSGMTHPKVLEALEAIHPTARGALAAGLVA